MSQSLYRIEQDLEQLTALRESAELEGDSEALKVIDQQIAEYLTKEAAKVTSYVGMIRCEELNAEACEKEAQRFLDIAKQKRTLVARLKETALTVMNRFGVRELKATPGGGLRIQGNSVQAMEIADIQVIPEGLKKYTVTMQGDLYHWLWSVITEFEKDHAIHPMAHLVMDNAETAPCTERIREALKRGEAIAGARLLPRGEHVRVL